MMFEKPLTDKQILKLFIELVQEHKSVTINTADPIKRSDRCIEDFTYRRMSAMKLIHLLDDTNIQRQILKDTNIVIYNNHRNITFTVRNDKEELCIKIIDQLVETVKHSREQKITISLFQPTINNDLVKNFLANEKIDAWFFLYVLESKRDILYKKLKLISSSAEYLTLSA